MQIANVFFTNEWSFNIADYFCLIFDVIPFKNKKTKINSTEA